MGANSLDRRSHLGTGRNNRQRTWQILQDEDLLISKLLGDEGMGSFGIEQNYRRNRINKKPTKHDLLRLLSIFHHHIVHSSFSWLAPHHRIDQRRARCRRRQLSKTRVGALGGIV